MTGVHRSEAWLQAQLSKTGRPPQKALSTKTAANRRGDAKSERLAGGAPNANSGSPPPTEHQIQAAFIQWCKLNEHRLPALKLAFAVPNGRKRTKAEAGMLKAEGVRAGVPDWWLPVPRKQFAGLVIEFKAPGKKPTVAQAAYMDLLIAENWLVYDDMSSVEQAIFSVEYYLS